MKKKQLKQRIRKILIIGVALSCGIISLMSITLGYFSTTHALDQSMRKTAEISSEQIDLQLDNIHRMCVMVSSMEQLSDKNVTPQEKHTLINQAIRGTAFVRAGMVDTNGKLLMGSTDADITNTKFFKEAMNGNMYVGEPFINPETGEYMMMVSTPVWNHGVPHSKVKGVAYFQTDETILNDVVKTIAFEKNSEAYILNRDGLVISSADKEKMCKFNSQEAVQKNSSYKSLAKIESGMLKGETGFDTYFNNGKLNVIAYAPIKDSDGWSIAVSSDISPFIRQNTMSILFTLLITALFIGLSVVIARKTANRIATPIVECEERLKLLSEGDLTSPVPQHPELTDEVGDLCTALQKTVERLNDLIGDVSENMELISQGDLSNSFDKEFRGDFKTLSTSMQTILKSLNKVMNNIDTAANQVSDGSLQVSQGAQGLSNGATEQASAVEQLAATINDISETVNKNAEISKGVSDDITEMGNRLTDGSEKMNEMIEAMGQISVKSTEIEKIVKTIEDIAFQTNILALNAAVEAARAGAAGKGFAVVADEVRNLASKSAEAAKSTTILINDTISAVENGKTIADTATDTIINIAKQSVDVVASVKNMSDLSQEQSTAINQVTQGVDQISNVIQTNSATAEQSAAASEELSAQAENLKHAVSLFKLNPEYSHSATEENNFPTHIDLPEPKGYSNVGTTFNDYDSKY